MPADVLTKMTTNLLALNDVQRWGVIKLNRRQSVAEHSFNVMVIAVELISRLGLGGNPAVLAQLYGWALIHDLPESMSADIDGRFKRDNPELKSALTAAERKTFPDYAEIADTVPVEINTIVKLADKIEAITYIKTWGVGYRAEDVYDELREILDNEQIPAASIVLRIIPPMGLKVMCHAIIQSIETERGSVQFEGRQGGE